MPLPWKHIVPSQGCCGPGGSCGRGRQSRLSHPVLAVTVPASATLSRGFRHSQTTPKEAFSLLLMTVTAERAGPALTEVRWSSTPACALTLRKTSCLHVLTLSAHPTRCAPGWAAMLPLQTWKSCLMFWIKQANWNTGVCSDSFSSWENVWNQLFQLEFTVFHQE